VARDTELSAIARLTAIFAKDGGAARGISLGIGDDAAILRPPAGQELVWTVDAQVEGRHFRRDWMTLEDIGWRSFVAAVSDVFAMGAEPWCALSALGVPSTVDAAGLDALARGQAEAANAAVCPIVGGNLTRSGELSITTTVLGSTVRPVRRDGARAGDRVWIAGEVGLARAGLLALERGTSAAVLDAAVAAYRRPRLRAESGRAVGRTASSAVDLSDGLSADVGHIAEASRVMVVLDERALEAHVGDALLRAASALGESWLELVLASGDDYALVATASEPIEGFTCVGSVEEGSGVWLVDARGARRPVTTPGFDHFRS
jgi:thiamine-monophosphate kinase